MRPSGTKSCAKGYRPLFLYVESVFDLTELHGHKKNLRLSDFQKPTHMQLIWP